MRKYFDNIVTFIKNHLHTPEADESEKGKVNFSSFFLFLFLAIALIILIFIIGKYVLIPMFPIVLLFLVLKWDSESNTSNLPQFQYPETYVLAELLCQILATHSDVLEIVKPENISEIIPTNYYVTQQIGNLMFYRFIILPKPNNEIDLEMMKESLHTFVSQQLYMGNCPNMQYTYYRNVPYFYIYKIEKDLYHRGYLHVDVFPVCNDEVYNFLITQNNLEQYQRKNNQIFGSPKDEDF